MAGLAARLQRLEASAPPCPTCRSVPEPHAWEPQEPCITCRRGLPLALGVEIRQRGTGAERERAAELGASFDAMPREELEAMCRITDRWHTAGHVWGTDPHPEELEERRPGQFYCRRSGAFIGTAEDFRLQAAALARLPEHTADEQQENATRRIGSRWAALGNAWGSGPAAGDMEERTPGHFYCRRTGAFLATTEELRQEAEALARGVPRGGAADR